MDEIKGIKIVNRKGVTFYLSNRFELAVCHDKELRGLMLDATQQTVKKSFVATLDEESNRFIVETIGDLYRYTLEGLKDIGEVIEGIETILIPEIEKDEHELISYYENNIATK
ncbi:hypothetical protein ACTWQB_15715 [Piscibacillus sp. B03]|uniref:hypothetical protein n=1 Tax=Piscibacillus sp. B03 TaxID=3457430 RepID=UPI003FCD6B8F